MTLTTARQTTGGTRAIAIARLTGSAAAMAIRGVATLALIIGGSAPAWAQSGSLDPTFGKGGKVTTDFSRKADLVQGVAVQPDGKIVAAGWATVSGAYQFGVVRYNTDGSLDTAFGIGGKVTTDFGVPGVEDTASGVALQADGKIVVVGTTDFTGNLDYQFAVARYNSDGSPDTTFSGDGKTTVSFFGSYNAGHAVAIQGDGKIVVAGFAGNSFAGLNDGRFGVARLNSNGDLDTTFGNYDDGKSLADFGGAISNATGVVIDSLGRIVVAGSSDVGIRNDFAIARFGATGQLDTTFGINTDGMVTTDFAGGDDFGQSLAIDGSGNVIVAGQAYGTNGIRTFALARYTSDGILDPSFSGGGLATATFSSYESYALGVAVQADQKVVVVGGAQVARRSSVVDFAVARFTSGGVLDPSFDTDGKVTTSFSSGAEVASAVALDPSNGDIVVAGQTQDKNFALARYLD